MKLNERAETSGCNRAENNWTLSLFQNVKHYHKITMKHCMLSKHLAKEQLPFIVCLFLTHFASQIGMAPAIKAASDVFKKHCSCLKVERQLW